MNVIISNKYTSLLNELDIDVIKKLEGQYDVDDIINQFKNFFFQRMILDITAIKDYKNNILINEILKLSSDTYYNAKEGYATAFSIKKENNKLTITAATSQNTKKEKTKDFVYDLTTKKRIN